jgi:hypothetical protein
MVAHHDLIRTVAFFDHTVAVPGAAGTCGPVVTGGDPGHRVLEDHPQEPN